MPWKTLENSEQITTERLSSGSEPHNLDLSVRRSESPECQKHMYRVASIANSRQSKDLQDEVLLPPPNLPLCPHCTKVVKHGMEYAHPESPWLPGFWKQFPWLGVLALMTAVLASVGCVIVLVESNEVPIDAWEAYFQPTVYLSICTALANATLTYALYEGLVISFWRKACLGTTLTELHQQWFSASSLWGAAQSIRKLRSKTMASACIMTFLSILRGPLIQRAASVSERTIQQQGNLTIYSAPRLPFGYTGFDTGRTQTPSMMNPNFTQIMQAYTNRDNISAAWTGCESTCVAAVQGFGFGVSCNQSAIPFSYNPFETIPGTNDLNTSMPSTMRVFEVDAGQGLDYNHGQSEFYYWFIESSGGRTDYVPPPKPNGVLLLNATFKAGPQSLNESIIGHVCALRAGVVRYEVQTSNTTLNLRSSSWRDDVFLEDYGFQASAYNSPSNLAGFIIAANSIYQGSADMQFGGGVGWILNTAGASANRYLEGSDASQNLFDVNENTTWRDPMEDMINSMREIAFRTALQIAVDNKTYVNATQVVPFTGQTIKTVYMTDYRFMFGAVALSLLGVVAVVPTFYGFWELGRSFTLSPLEIAKAFGGPLLRDLPGNRPAKDMLVWAEEEKIRYADTETGPRSRLSDPKQNVEDDVGRLEMGLLSAVRPLEKGFNYM